ncbi:MAG: glycine cleavage system aminomethyltransferase GcvT [Bacteroidales bacterium]|nr:glycine cleavage system aminomethyltransferase GcvT [Bacteroidales bacterium]
METLKVTPLHESHLALGAKMSPFAGFDMPISYSGIVDEHMAVRGKAGVFDVSHMGEIEICGPGAEAFVNHIFTNDVCGMQPGVVLYGMMLYPDGGVVDDLLVYRLFTPEPSFFLVVNAANIEKDFDWMRANAGGFDITLRNRSEQWGQIALQGPESETVLADVLGIREGGQLRFYTFVQISWRGDPLILSRTGYTGEDGFELYSTPSSTQLLWKTLVDAGVKPCGLGCRDTLRFEAGMPLYGHELSESISPVMAGLSVFCKLDKPDFIGRQALAVQKANGTERRLVGIELEENAVPRAGYPVELADGTQVGVVTTGYHSLTLDKSLCFALVDSACSAIGTPLWVHIRRHSFRGSVVKKNFYKTNYKK